MAKNPRTLTSNGITENAKLVEITIESLPKKAQELFTQYKAAYKAATAVRDQFEAVMQDLALANKTTVADKTELFFGYNFGKLAIGVADRTVKSASSRKAVDFAKLVA